jgi:hypothetical protein
MIRTPHRNHTYTVVVSWFVEEENNNNTGYSMLD